MKLIWVFGLLLVSMGFATDINTCQNLSSAGTTYTLNQSVSIAGQTCFNVTAENVTLDCQGFGVTGDNTISANGINSNQFNTTIQNCQISSFGNGIKLNSNSNTVQNVNVSVAVTSGIWLLSSSNNILSDSTFNGTNTGGISVDYTGVSANNSFFNIVAISSDGNGVYLKGNNYTLTNVSINSGSAYSLYANSLKNSILTNILAISLGDGLSFNNGANNTIDCQGKSIVGSNASNTNGIYSNEFNTTIRNCTISNFAKGIYFDSAAYGTINNATVSTSSGSAIEINGNYNAITNSQLTCTGNANCIFIDGTVGSLIENVSISFKFFGVLIGNSAGEPENNTLNNVTAVVNEAIAHASSEGIAIWAGTGNVVNNSTGIARMFGIDMETTGYVGQHSYLYNSYAQCTGAGAYNSALYTSNTITVTNNTIIGSNNCMGIYSGNNATFSHNTIQAKVWVNGAGTNSTYNCNKYLFADGSASWTTYPVYDNTGDSCADFGNNLPYYYWTMPTNWIGLGYDYSPFTNLTSAQTGTLVQILVVDNAYKPVLNTSVKIVQINAANNTNSTLGLFTVDEFGTTTTTLLPLTMLYAFSVYNQNGSTLIQAFPQTGLSCTTSNILCKHTLIVNINSVLPFYIRNNLVGSCSYNNSSLTINCQASDGTSTLNNYSISAFAQGNSTQACYNSSAGSTANLNCTLPAACGYYNYLFLGSDGTFSYMLSADTITANGCPSTTSFGRSGWVAMLLIFGTIALIGSYSLPIAMMFGVMSLFFGMLVQLIPWTAGTPTIIFLVIALIIAYRSKV